jgi:hypothetical protein
VNYVEVITCLALPPLNMPKNIKGEERLTNLSVFEKLNKKTHNLIQSHNCFVNCRLLELP